jgi:hypothetical protein
MEPTISIDTLEISDYFKTLATILCKINEKIYAPAPSLMLISDW